MMMIRGKWALVTGASSGIGEATAIQLAELGVNLILLARRAEKLQQLAQNLSSKVQVHTLAVDITDRESLAPALKALPVFRNTSILVNNAGLALGADRVQHGQYEDWEKMVSLNILGLLSITNICLPTLLENPGSHIVNIGSVAGRWVYPGGNVYCATKFAVGALTEGFRLDLLGKPIRVTNIEPGMVETEFSQVRFQDMDKARDVYKGMTPLTAQDVADSIVWCLTRPSHVNVAEVVLYPTDQASVRDVHRSQT